MLADICETSVRAMKPNSAQEIDEIVQKMIADKVSSGQLNECNLTIADLYIIRTAFVDILQGVHHPRIKYPDQIKKETEAEPSPNSSFRGTKFRSTLSLRGRVRQADTPTAASPPPIQPLMAKSEARPTPLVRRE